MTILSPVGEFTLIMVVTICAINLFKLSRRVAKLEHRRGRRNR